MKKSAKSKRASSSNPVEASSRKAVSLKTLKPKEPTSAELRNVVGGLKRNPLG
jgi:hypothetical protein